MMSSARYIAPRSDVPRPPLPIEHANSQLLRIDPAKPLPVKFQEISRDGHVALVGRIKIPTPNGHAFILRRLDTEAISLTTMFRAAYPEASDDAEKAELSWIKANYDLSGANKSGKSRFAGTWATIDVALAIADTYSISHLLPPLIEAKPDPKQTLSKEKRKQVAQPLTPQPTPESPVKSGGPSKRRKQSSPQPVIHSSPAAAAVVSPRRSIRLKSPAPMAMVPLPLSPRRTPKAIRVRDELAEAAAREAERLQEEAAALAQEVEQDPLMEQEIEEQQELVERLKAERAARDQDEAMNNESDRVSGVKRTIAEVEPPLELNIQEPQLEVRKVATNNRIRGMAPERKSLAWGVAAFAAGIGAILLPNLWL